jgi:hypothetical protein
LRGGGHVGGGEAGVGGGEGDFEVVEADCGGDNDTGRVRVRVGMIKGRR